MNELVGKYAGMLNGREYKKRLLPGEACQAKAAGIVIAYGISLDLFKLEGAISDSADCFKGGIFKLTASGGIIKNECEDYYCPYFKKLWDECPNEIKAIFDNASDSWTYKTAIPHESFDILARGKKYCRGIVFHIDDLK